MNSDSDHRVQSPRPDTPEPGSRQGRRNQGVQLLDDEGRISDQVCLSACHPHMYLAFITIQLESCLKHIFAKYCVPAPATPQNPSQDKRSAMALLSPPEGAYFTQEGLDAWARDTNGSPFSAETKEELVEFLDVTDDGGLTWVDLANAI